MREHVLALRQIEEAVKALSPPMHLLARMTTAQPALAVSLVQMRVPSTAGDESGRDLVSLVASALSVLPQLHAHAQLRPRLLLVLGAASGSLPKIIHIMPESS